MCACLGAGEFMRLAVWVGLHVKNYRGVGTMANSDFWMKWVNVGVYSNFMINEGTRTAIIGKICL